MEREEIKSYKDACRVLGRKPRTYKDKHLNLYEQLTTIIAALNFISNDNKPWIPELKYYYIFAYLHTDNKYNKLVGEFCLYSYDSVALSGARIGASLKIRKYSDGKYIIANFKDLLQEWFWGDLITK